jgi:hypothetical protein
MLARTYFILGLLLLVGYGVSAFEGWEFGNAMRVYPVPPVGSSLTSSARYHSGRSSWVFISGGK